MLKVQVLGCGTSSGVPTVLGDWGDCDPSEPKNRRRRASIMLEFNGFTLLVDTGPDLREQLIDADWDTIDAVFYTHDHADHVNGIDDLRFVSWSQKRGPLPVYSTADFVSSITERHQYIFEGFGLYKAFLEAHTLDEKAGTFSFADRDFSFWRQPHGSVQSLGFRTGNFAYCTDCVDFDETHFARLEGLDVLLVDAVRLEPHKTHAHLDMVLEWVERLKPKQTYLTHMNPDMDWATLCERLPAHIRPAYDGQVIEMD